MQRSFVGEIIRESLIDLTVLNGFKSFLVKSRVQNVKNFGPPLWHLERYRMPIESMKQLIPLIENNINKSEWYIHFYAEDANEMFVVLPGKTFQLPKYKDSSWTKMIEYGEQVGVGRHWTENIPVDFKN